MDSAHAQRRARHPFSGAALLTASKCMSLLRAKDPPRLRECSLAGRYRDRVAVWSTRYLPLGSGVNGTPKAHQARQLGTRQGFRPKGATRAAALPTALPRSDPGRVRRATLAAHHSPNWPRLLDSGRPRAGAAMSRLAKRLGHRSTPYSGKRACERQGTTALRVLPEAVSYARPVCPARTLRRVSP